MTLIFILIALGLDFFLGGIERYRNYHWFVALFYFLEKRLAHYKYWDGCIGLITLFSIPVLAFVLIISFLGNWSSLLEGLLTLLILVYCLAPQALNDRLDHYINAVNEDDADNMALLSDELIDQTLMDDNDTNEVALIKSAFIEAHKRCFAVIFWFIVLGAIGVLLYRLIDEINNELQDINSGFADSARLLLNIFEWPSARIMIITMALAGSLGNVFSGWKNSDHLTFNVNNEAIIEAGMRALQYMPEVEVAAREKSYWISELKALINRTLIICLTILGIVTLSGRLA